MQKAKSFAYSLALVFSFFGLLFVPFSFGFFGFQNAITSFVFEGLLLKVASCFDFLVIKNPEITSDSTSFYLLFVVLFLLALVFTIVLQFFSFWKKNQRLFLNLIPLVLNYYLAIVMLKYGFGKIFKNQFYLPEPNILYTPVGMLDKDILFWTTMGTSYSYNIFLGLLEVIPALMLLFYRTRILGLLILSVVLTHVVFVNFGFDISVKLYSLFLLFICLLLLFPFLKQIFQFFVLQQSTILVVFSGKNLVGSRIMRFGIKTVVFFDFFIEPFVPYFKTKQFNDDMVPRMPLHGAYQVFKTEKINNTAADLDIKRIFFHRQQYLIFQDANDNMKDFTLKIDQSKGKLELVDEDGSKFFFSYKFSVATQVLELTSQELGVVLYSKSMAWRELPALQPLFHWTVDQVR